MFSIVFILLSFKIAINNSWAENYGCNGLNGPNCAFFPGYDGSIRLIFNIETIRLTSDNKTQTTTKITQESKVSSTHLYTSTNDYISSQSDTSIFSSSINCYTTSKSDTTSSISIYENPIKPCASNCPPCTNKFATKLLSATGDWPVDLGALKNWEATESKGIFTFDQHLCAYTLVLLGLKPNINYNWFQTYKFTACTLDCSKNF